MTEAPVSTSLSSRPVLPTKPKYDRSQIRTSVILNRIPVITRTPTDFERAYYAYQARIRRALHNPFPYDFYFKQGSLLETRFNLEEFKRERKAFGSEFARGQYSDEKVAADRTAVEQLAKQEGEDEKLASRNPSADLNNHKSLDRKLGRNLYLVVEGKEGWYFPMGELEKGELLHQAAQRGLHAAVGAYMDSWIVSRNPIGVMKHPTEKKIFFFFKGHILAGQARLEDTSLKDFAWLTKQEIGERLRSPYWEGVRDMISDH